MRVQFRYEVSEHLGRSSGTQYIHEQRTEQSEVMALDTHRLQYVETGRRTAASSLRTGSHVYFIWDPRIHAKLYHSVQQNRSLLWIHTSQKNAIQRTRRAGMRPTWLEFESILRGIEGSAWRRPTAAPRL